MCDEKFMAYAVELAKKGEGFINPNPVVGAVIVKDGKIIGKGYHKKYGGLHAERNALNSCRESPKGAEMYVTLEPCCHYGKTPPCTEAIIEAGISKVIVGSKDPNPKVCGKGAAKLRAAGIAVEEGVLKETCDGLNDVFFHYITSKTPYVAMKYAMTADGKIASAGGLSRWITGEGARRHAHCLRNKYSGVMAGIGTVLKDDPLLTCRIENGRNPVRIICDSRLSIPLDSRICRTAKEVTTFIASSCADGEKKRRLESLGITVLNLPGSGGRVDLRALMEKLGGLGIDGILLEGGGNLNYGALKAGIVNEIDIYIAPKIFGGETAETPVEGKGIKDPNDCLLLSSPEIKVLGKDLLLRYKNLKGRL